MDLYFGLSLDVQGHKVLIASVAYTKAEALQKGRERLPACPGRVFRLGCDPADIAAWLRGHGLSREDARAAVRGIGGRFREIARAMRERRHAKEELMMRFLLNSAVLTAPGAYRYRLVTPDEARAWADAGPWTSTIGYAATAELLTEILDAVVQVRNDPCTMQPGDEALVCRFALGQRLDRRLKSGDQGRQYAEEQFRLGNFELGLLTRLE